MYGIQVHRTGKRVKIPVVDKRCLGVAFNTEIYQ